MLVCNKKKSMYDFYNKHKFFLYWYLKKHTNLPEKFYYLLMQYIVECIMEDIETLNDCSEQEQCVWIMKRVDDFTTEE